MSTEVVGIQKLYYSCVYRSGGYTEAVILVCLLKWWVYRNCITSVSTGAVCIQKLYYCTPVSTGVVRIHKLYYACVYWSGACTEAVLLVCKLKWWVYRSCVTPVYTGVERIQKLYYSCVNWSGGYTEAVLLKCLLEWCVY
jgi:hypothetical protein